MRKNFKRKGVKSSPVLIDIFNPLSNPDIILSTYSYFIIKLIEILSTPEELR